MLATPDGGAVVMGVEYSNVSYLVNAWMMKVDADLNMEWFNEYYYDLNFPYWLSYCLG